MLLFLQFIVLALTVTLWWLARRDLTQRAAQVRAGEAQEMERLRAGVEALAADLERRAEAAEQRLTGRIAQAHSVSFPLPRREAASLSGSEEAEERYAAVYALAADGVADPTEIARRTGLGRSEIELLLRLRARPIP